METAGNYPWDQLPPPSNLGFQQNPNNRRHNFHSDLPDEPFAAGYPHFKPHFARKRKFDYYAKLFVGGITRTVTQQEIHCMFEEHGKVIEVVILHDKKTGQQQEYCFVKYASMEEADRAIAALHNQYMLPGATGPLRVKYADGERERLAHYVGLIRFEATFSGPGMVHKVYVNGLHKEASEEEIREIFSSYGLVVDVYIMRDPSRQSRGCGFVGFSQRYMAIAAINGLDGTYTMRGCDRPLAVRFADPKKPKNVELRFGSTVADVRGSNWLNASHAEDPSATQESTTNIQPGVFCPIGKQLQCPGSCEMEQPSDPRVKQLDTLQVTSQSSRQIGSQLQTFSHFNQTSDGNMKHCHDSQAPPQCGDFVESSAAVLSSDPLTSALSGNSIPEASLDCDWSEHVCPDGYKYYFNCVTCESRWERPEEFSLYEQHLHNLSCQDHHPLSTSDTHSCEEVSQIQGAEVQKQLCDFEKSQLPISCAVEHGHEQIQSQTCPLDGPALIN